MKGRKLATHFPLLPKRTTIGKTVYEVTSYLPIGNNRSLLEHMENLIKRDIA